MKRVFYFLFFVNTLYLSASDSSAIKRFTFRAGVGNSLNYFKPIADNIVGYKKIGLGNGLGTEMSYFFKERWAVNVFYYLYYYKNKTAYSGSFIRDEFDLMQQNHFIGTGVSYKLVQKEKNSILLSTGVGIIKKNEQYLVLNSSKQPEYLYYKKSIKYAQPIAISFENYIKGKIILGVSVQTFILGQKHPVNGAYLFSYLGLPF